MATLRERVERQRSVQSSVNHGSESNSLEGLNLERGDSSHKSRCVEQLDNQVSSLHQDVAALSMEVRLCYTPLLQIFTSYRKNIVQKRITKIVRSVLYGDDSKSNQLFRYTFSFLCLDAQFFLTRSHKVRCHCTSDFSNCKIPRSSDRFEMQYTPCRRLLRTQRWHRKSIWVAAFRRHVRYQIFQTNRVL